MISPSFATTGAERPSFYLPSSSSSSPSFFSSAVLPASVKAAEASQSIPPPLAASASASTSTSTLPSSPALYLPHSIRERLRASRDRARKDKSSWDYVVRSGLAGGVAGCVAKTVIAPLDRVKILFQARNPEFQKYAGTWTGVFIAAREIFRTSGLRGLLQGHSATLLRIFPYATIKFMAYEQFNNILMPTPESKSGARLFLAGSLSGVTSVLLTYPLELVRVRLAFETKRALTKNGLVNIIRQIYSEGSTLAPFARDARRRAALAETAARMASERSSSAGGQAPSSAIFNRFPLLKFYRGFSVTMLGMIPYAGTSFLVFDRAKSALRWFFGHNASLEPVRGGGNSDVPIRPSRGDSELSKATLDLAAGGIAGALSQTAAYPFEVVRRRMQIGGLLAPDRSLGLAETVKGIYRMAGWRGFFVGLSIGYLKVVPMTSISFATWVGMKRALLE